MSSIISALREAHELVDYGILSLGLFFGALWLVDRANAVASLAGAAQEVSA